MGQNQFVSTYHRRMSGLICAKCQAKEETSFIFFESGGNIIRVDGAGPVKHGRVCARALSCLRHRKKQRSIEASSEKCALSITRPGCSGNKMPQHAGARQRTNLQFTWPRSVSVNYC